MDDVAGAKDHSVVLEDFLNALVAHFRKACCEVGGGADKTGRVVSIAVWFFVVFSQNFWDGDAFGHELLR